MLLTCFDLVMNCLIKCSFKQAKCRHWGSERPDYHLERSSHSDKVAGWAALSKDGVFFEDKDGQSETIKSERYLKIAIKQKFIPSLRKKGFNPDYIWFQQDGAPPHTSGVVLEWLEQTFEDELFP